MTEAQPIIRADLSEKPRRPLNLNVSDHNLTSSATMAILLTVAAYVSIPVLIVIGVVWLTNCEDPTHTNGPTTSFLRRIGVPLQLLAAIPPIALLFYLNLPTGEVETVTGRVVAGHKSKFGYRLTLFFKDGHTTYIESPRNLPNQTEIECHRQQVRFGGYDYQCEAQPK